MTIPAKQQSAPLPSTIEDVLIGGDLSKLTPDQRTVYYKNVCESLGLNHYTRPFDYLTLNNKLQLYARKDATDQLRKLHGISVEVVSQYQNSEGLYTVHARAKDKDGRTDEDFGVVSMGNLKGEFAANMILKCVTKAKRRVTLSICGLGFLDETEIEDIPEAKAPEPTKTNWEIFADKLLLKIKRTSSRQDANRILSANAKGLKEMEREEESTFRKLDNDIQAVFRGDNQVEPGAELADELRGGAE